MTKTCSKCKIEKEVERFSFRDIATGLRVNVCKDCHSIYVKEHYKKNRDLYISRGKISSKISGRKVRANRHQKMMRFLEGKSCIDCGESDPVVLEFDHRDGEEKEDSISVLMAKSWKKVVKEIEKCDIRCANCHRRKTAKQLGWYKDLLKAE